jgi:hypothetical protein
MHWPPGSGISMSMKASVALRGRHEVLALDDRQQMQHMGVEHVPGADLLLDHVETGLFQVHERGSSGSPG